MSFDLEEAINEYAKSISVTHSLDPAVREEFTSHLREKVDYYLAKRQLTAEEAFRLAVQAIGDPKGFVPALKQVHYGQRIADRSIDLFDVGVWVLAAYETPAVIMGLIVTILSHVAPDFTRLALISPVLTAASIPLIVLCTWLAYKFVLALHAQPGSESRSFLARLGPSRLRASLIAWLGAAVLIQGARIGSYNLVLLTPLILPLPSGPKGHEIAYFVYGFISYYVLHPLFFALLAYLACRVISLDDRRPSRVAKAAFVPMAAFLAFVPVLLGLSYVMHNLRQPLGIETGSYYYSLTLPFGYLAVGSLRLLAVSAVSCALGWLAFELQQRARRSASG